MHLIFDTFRITMQRPCFLHRSVLNKRPPLCKVKKEEESVCAAAIAATVAHVTKTWITITQNNSLYIAAWIMYKNKERKKNQWWNIIFLARHSDDMLSDYIFGNLLPCLQSIHFFCSPKIKRIITKRIDIFFDHFA